MMSDSSKKLKNPLLTAAGQGFSFEDHGGTNLLLPVIQPLVSGPRSTERDKNPSHTSVLGPEISTQVIRQNLDDCFSTSLSGNSCGSSSYSLPVDDQNLKASPVALATSIPQIPTTASASTYRLGNQRRLKYVPPPNLTSTIPKPPIQLPIIRPPSIVDSTISVNNLLEPTQNITVIGSDSTPLAGSNQSHEAIAVPQVNFLTTSPVVLSSNTYQDYTDNESSLQKPSVASPISPQIPLTSIPLEKNISRKSDLSDNSFKNSTVTSGATTVFGVKINSTLVADEPAQIDLIHSPHSLDVAQIRQPPANLIGNQFNPTNHLTSDVSSHCNPGGFPTIYKSPSQFFTPTLANNPTPQLPSPIYSVCDSISQAKFGTGAMPDPIVPATLNPTQKTLNYSMGDCSNVESETLPYSFEKLASAPAITKKMSYRPVYYHWFFCREVENKIIWTPFSMQDSLNLETVYNSNEITPETTVPTDGGRYDVEILKRQRSPVYWSGPPVEVRRSSWFYKGPLESRYIPYDENTAITLEEEYKQACLTNEWNRRVELKNGEYIIFHNSMIQVHYLPTTSPELVASWGNSASAASRPKVVKRGVDEFHIDEGEPEIIDHLLFLVHGIGSVCDLKFRTVEEVVDEFRSISFQLVQSHYRTANTHGVVNRIEVLPISWHATLHSEATGIDKKLEAITLESIPKLRHFTNDTLLDVLFYTSPTYCQTIMQTVGNEMNRIHTMFKQRNPGFSGSVYLGGHSLGSLILFDLLCHQKLPVDRLQDGVLDESVNPADDENVDELSTLTKPMSQSTLKHRLSRRVSYVMGTAGTGQPFINYPQLSFHPKAFFALGSPIGMFVTVRGIDNLGKNFALPTCPAFFNIFHPFDPVAYRIESLVNAEAYKYRPMLIPHHKGRKRMHLELKETMARVGADLKQRVLDSMRSTWNSVYHLAMFHRSDNHELEQEIDKVVGEQLQSSCEHPGTASGTMDDDGDNENKTPNFDIGKLNGGRRIDYVLQEAPFEYINEYIFALTSHVCYWESEDTMLFILKEMYGSNGIQADAQLPQQMMTTELAQLPPSTVSASQTGNAPKYVPSTTVCEVVHTEMSSMLSQTDPMIPTTSNKLVHPPPTQGFIRKASSNRE